MKSAHVVSLFAVASLSLAFACGSESSTFGEGSTSSSGGAGSSSGGFGTGDGGSGADGSSGGTSSGGTNCLAPVDMFIMFDRSGSMGRDKGNGFGDPKLDCDIGQNVESKWCRAINALSGYFKSAGSTNQAAALQFFPREGHKSADCNSGNGYQTAVRPAAEYQLLPSDVFDADLNAAKPDTGGGSPGTPTEGAIRGLTRFTEANRRGGRVTIGILLTDGDPTNSNGFECNTELADLSALLKTHHDATQVRTYVIGMDGASDDNLESIAAGGDAPLHANDLPGISNSCGNGTAQCRHWNVGGGDPAVFTAVLKAIQESADGCSDGGGFVNPVK